MRLHRVSSECFHKTGNRHGQDEDICYEERDGIAIVTLNETGQEERADGSDGRRRGEQR